MLKSEQRIDTLDDLRDYVNETLCEHEQLEIGAFHMTELLLRRGSKCCGLYFCLHGPRETKFSAIWETENNTVLFYDSTGERFLKTRLLAALCLELVAA
jgi:hypothetical protein